MRDPDAAGAPGNGAEVISLAERTAEARTKSIDAARSLVQELMEQRLRAAFDDILTDPTKLARVGGNLLLEDVVRAFLEGSEAALQDLASRWRAGAH